MNRNAIPKIRKKKSKSNKNKNKMAGIKSSLSSAYEVYAEFCKETTVHGVKHTVAENLHWFERLVWFILIISAFCGAIYCGLIQLSRYNSEPVVVSLQRDYRDWWTTFPAITACYMDRVDITRAKEVIERIWNVTEEGDPDKYEYYSAFIQLVADVSLRTNLQNFWKYQDDDTVKDIDLLQLALEVHPTHDVNVNVAQTSKEVQWTPVMTEVGMCMTFNSEYAQFQFIFSDVEWTSSELVKCHFHSAQCYVRIDSGNNPIRYFVHSPFEITTAISNPTGEVMPGEQLIIDFKTVEIQASPGVKKLGPEQRRCRYPDEQISSNVKAYSFGLCQMQCRNRMSLMFCGCRPYFHVKGASLGGTTALFVGASVLTAVETLLFITRQLTRLMILKLRV